MKTSILGILLSLLFYSQPIWAESLNTGNNNKIQYRHLRVEYGVEVKFIYNNTVYTVYAAKCNTITTDPKNLNYIVLKPGEPIELKDLNGNILILFSLPCN
jgi:hypothetical protein